MKEEYFMNEALKEAEIAFREGNWPIGCVIELDGKIISRSHNQVYSLNNKLAHAEMLGLQNSQEILLANKRQATLYTTYEPCPMCFGGIILSRIKRVVAGVDLDQSGAMYFRENLPLLFKQKKFCVDFFPGVLAEECSRVFMKSEMAREMEKNGLIKKVLL